MTNAAIATILFHDVVAPHERSGFQRRGAISYRYTREAFDDVLQSIRRLELSPSLCTSLDFKSPPRQLLLTFDDGGTSAEYIADELARFNWRGHFFITTSLIGAPGFLDSAQIRRIRADGHIIGSHSHTHPNIFRSLTSQQMCSEWQISQDILEDLLGEPCVCASVPGGDVSLSVIESASNCDYQYIFTSDPYLYPKRFNDSWIIGRVCPKSGTPTNQILKLAQGNGWFRERVKRSVKKCLRFFFFPLYKEYVRRTVTQDK